MFARAIEAVEAGETFSSALEMVSSVDSKREIIKPFSDIGDALKGNNSVFFFMSPRLETIYLHGPMVIMIKDTKRQSAT